VLFVKSFDASAGILLSTPDLLEASKVSQHNTTSVPLKAKAS
jgi:hypothetical protein